MVKVITYGTYDLLHHGHIKLLERAKALGDYLIVGVTADDFDKMRGKINVQQSLMERVEAIRATGLADKIIIEEYEGQKIDDIRRMDVDIFTVGSDWTGHFDYLKEYCQVVYLDRTQGISSSEVREKRRKIRMGCIGESMVVQKFLKEAKYVNGLQIDCIYSTSEVDFGVRKTNNLMELLEEVDAVYVFSNPSYHFEQIRTALEKGKHVLCEAPIALTNAQSSELHRLAEEKNCILMDSIKTAYATAYSRMLNVVKGGKIGDVISVDATATSLRDIELIEGNNVGSAWNSITAWGPTVMLPVFQLLGVDYREKRIISRMMNETFDLFTKVDFIYESATATVKVGKGVKSEGELIVSGTKGYIYVPAPWWKTDYFELRYEDAAENRRYFYQLEGEGIRYELVAFLNAIETGKDRSYISRKISDAICKIIEDFYGKKDFIQLK